MLLQLDYIGPFEFRLTSHVPWPLLFLLWSLEPARNSRLLVGKRPILPVGSKKDHQKLHSSCHWKHNQVIFHRLTAARLSALPPLFSCYFVRVGGDINGNRSDDEHRLEWSKTDGRLHDMGSPPDRNHSEMMLLKNPLATICKQLSDQVLAK